MAHGYPDYRFWSIPALVGEGGTGRSTLTEHAVVVGNLTSAVELVGPGLADQILRTPTDGAAPAWGALDLSKAAAVTGLLPVAKGGWGTDTGSFTSPGAISLNAGGSNQDISLIPSGAGYVNISRPSLSGNGLASGTFTLSVASHQPTDNDYVLWAQNNITGTPPANKTSAGLNGQLNVVGTFGVAPAGFVGVGLEGVAAVFSTGGTLPDVRGGTFGIDTVAGSTTNITNATAVYGQGLSKAGTGTITNSFTAVFEGTVAGALRNYAVVLGGELLTGNGTGIYAGVFTPGTNGQSWRCVDEATGSAYPFVTFGGVLAGSNTILWRSLDDAKGHCWANQAGTVEWVRFADAKVGIGTPTPASKLSIQDTTTIAGEVGHLRLADVTTPDKRVIAGYDVTGGIDAGYIQALHGGVGYKPLLLQPLGGYLGVRNTAPTEVLDVTGNVKFSGALMPNNAAGSSGQCLVSAGAGNPPVWSTPDGARVYNSADETITPGTPTALTFDTERYDNGGLHSTTSNTSRLTAVRAGKYLITGHVIWDAGSSGSRWVRIRLDGATMIAGINDDGPSAGSPVQSVATVYDLAATHYVELEVMHYQGTDLKVLAVPNYSPEFAMQWLGP
jgi:hypothetical protein